MVTVYYYSAEVVVSGGAFPDNLWAEPAAFLDGTYGLLSIRDRYDFTTREWVNLSNGLERIDVVSGVAGPEISLPLIGFQLLQLAGGRFVAGGLVYPDDGGAARSLFRVMAADGTLVGRDHRIGGGGIEASAPQSIVPLANGGFVLSWNQYDFANATSRWDGAFQIFDRKSRATGEVVEIVAPGDQEAPMMAVLSGGQLVATWIDKASGWALRGQVFGLDGVALGGVMTLATAADNYRSDQKLATFSDGSFAVMWATEIFDFDVGTSTTTFTLQRFAQNGTALSVEVDFATRVGDTGMGSISYPQMTALADGRIVVAWTESQEAPLNDLGRQFYTWNLMRIYEANGTVASVIYSLGADDGLESGIRIVALEDGRIAASWQRYNPDTSSNDVVTQIFDERDAGVRLDGNALNNQYAGSTFADVLKGVAGNDTLFGNVGDDSLFGGLGTDVVLGGFGNDLLFGGDGNDDVSGFDGADRLVGGRGNDLLTGGRGADVFVFSPGDGVDKIKGFADLQDRLDLSDHGFAGVAAALRHFAAVDGGVLFSAGGDAVFVAGLTLAQLSGADFILG